MKKHLLIIVVIIVFLSTIHYTNAQTRTVKGIVFNSDTNIPLKGITVSIKNIEKSTITDEKGEFTLDISPSIQNITFDDFIGMKTNEIRNVDSNTYYIYLSKYQDIYDLTLEDLINVDIVTVSKKSTNLAQAPAIISVISKKDIQEKGYQSLTEVLTTIAGVNAIETYWGFNQLLFRGAYSTLYNDKTLVLINGHPFWDAINGSHYIESFPIDVIERIEVIRGPGSTLYGTNAYAGVINIITTQNNKIIEQTSAFAKMKNSMNYEACATTSNAIKDFSWMISVDGKGGRGYDFNIPELEGNKTNVNYNYLNNYNSVFSKINFKQLSLDFYAFDQDKSKIDAAPFVWGSLKQTLNNFKGVFYGLTYQNKISKKLTLVVRGSYNDIFRIFNSRYSSKYARYESLGSRSDMEINLNYVLNYNINIMAGAQYEYMFADYYNFYDANTDTIIAYGFGKEDRTDNITSGFLQSDFKINERLDFVAGIRYSYNKYYNNSINPRGGIVFKVVDGLYLKALYGNAFRSPNFFEKYWNFGTTFGTENLSTEKINSFELESEYTHKNISAKLNYYYNISTDIIGRALQQNGTTKYVNISGNSITQGIEAEIKYKYRFLDYYLNGSFILPTDTGKKVIKYVPAILFNTGIVLSYKQINTHLYANYTDKVNNKVKNIDQKIPSFAIFNFKVGYNLLNQTNISFLANNIFNQAIWAPEFIRRNIVKLPNGLGRNFTIEIRKTF